jgi:hypothetical protein
MAIGRIHEVDLAEGALLHEGEHEGVDLGPDGTMTSRASDWRPLASAWTIPRPGSRPTVWQARIASASTSA